MKHKSQVLATNSYRYPTQCNPKNVPSATDMEMRSSVTMSSQALKELLYGAKNNVQAIQEERPQSQLLSNQLQLKLAEGDYEVAQEK